MYLFDFAQFKGILVIKTVENRMNIFSLNDLFVLCKTELLGLNKTVYKYIYIYTHIIEMIVFAM